jgi:hypothetical protein
MAEVQVAQRTDPSAESPAGVIYQIPLDSARRDAAPVLPTRRQGGRTGRSGSAAGESAASGAGTPGGSGPSGHSGPSGNSGTSGGSGSAAGADGGRSGSSAAPAAAGGNNLAARRESSSTSGDGGANGGTPQDPSSIHSENGFGSSSQVPGTSQAAQRTGAGVSTSRPAGSVAPNFLLIALIAAAAIGMGLLATRHSRLRDDWPSSTPDL